MSEKLQITVQSFSYRNGYPEDPTGNGGGFVFDCRAISNPYYFEHLRFLTGKAPEMEDFFTKDTQMPCFLESVKKIVELAVTDYLDRGFACLQINFGCTGGQHRSVYSAEQTAAYLRKKYPQAEVILNHLNSANWKLKNHESTLNPTL